MMKRVIVAMSMVLLISSSILFAGCAKATAKVQASDDINANAFPIQIVKVPMSWGKVVNTSVDAGFATYVFTFESGDVLSIFSNCAGGWESRVFRFIGE
jgi:hypothetical protein